jgi:UDPglucose 6-dehydrogenase
MIKYAANAFLATKISFANEFANLCETFGVDVYEVMRGIGLDSRINPEFLNAGCGFGGSCFPKDINAIMHAAKSRNIETKLLNAVLAVNRAQPLRVIELTEGTLGNLHGKRIALLGLAFKPGTDDTRATRALPILEQLIEKGAQVTVYDPRAMDNFRRLIENSFPEPPEIKYAPGLREALKDADACIIQSDWDEFKKLTGEDFIELMNDPVVIDGRRTFENPAELTSAGVTYRGIGWKNMDYEQ